MAASRTGVNNNEVKPEGLSVWARMKRWMKQHPFITGLLIGGLITGAVFTGGALLAPVALAAMTTAGTWMMTGLLAVSVLSVGLIATYRTAYDRGGKTKLTWTEWFWGIAFSAGAGAGAGYGGFALAMAVPLVAVSLCGVAAAAAGALVVGSFAWLGNQILRMVGYGSAEKAPVVKSELASVPVPSAPSPVASNVDRFFISTNTATDTAANTMTPVMSASAQPMGTVSPEDKKMIQQLSTDIDTLSATVQRNTICCFFKGKAANDASQQLHAAQIFKTYLRNPNNSHLEAVSKIASAIRARLMTQYAEINHVGCELLKGRLAALKQQPSQYQRGDSEPGYSSAMRQGQGS